MSDQKDDKDEAGSDPITASRLRENVYRILDDVLMTGEAVEVYRKGAVLRIEPPTRKPKGRRLDLLPKRNLIAGDPDDLVHMDWSHEWRP